MQMKKILHVSCSPRGQAAESYRLSQKIIGLLLQKEPTRKYVVIRAIGGAIPEIDEGYAIALAVTQRRPLDTSRRLHVPFRRTHPGAGKLRLCGHRISDAELHRACHAEGVDLSRRSSPSNV